MRGVSGALVVTAALLVCCTADLHQDSDIQENSGDQYDPGSKPSDVDHVGGKLVRVTRETRHYSHIPYLLARRHDYTRSPDSESARPARNEQWFLNKNSGYNGEEYPKRNFDEIDLSGLDNFVRKRNFDEIDQTAMPFPLAKRFGVSGPNHHDMSNFGKKRFRADYPMDEIDLSEFPMGSKRSY